MAKRRQPPPPVRPLRAPAATAAPPMPPIPPVDFWELATGVFVVVAALLPAGPLFAYAGDIVVTTVFFEFGMAWLAACASSAESIKSRPGRIAAVALGALLVAAVGMQHAFKLDVLGTMLPGLWIIATRLRKPAGVELFGVRHCRTISYEAMAAWCTLLGIFAAMMLLQTALRGRGPVDLTKGGLFALAWGGFYGTLALVMPFARRKALEPRAAKTPRRGRG